MEDIIIEGAKLVGGAVTGGAVLALYQQWSKNRDGQQAYIDRKNNEYIDRITARNVLLEAIAAEQDKVISKLKQENFALLCKTGGVPC